MLKQTYLVKKKIKVLWLLLPKYINILIYWKKWNMYSTNYYKSFQILISFNGCLKPYQTGYSPDAEFILLPHTKSQEHSDFLIKKHPIAFEQIALARSNCFIPNFQSFFFFFFSFRISKIKLFHLFEDIWSI